MTATETLATELVSLMRGLRDLHGAVTAASEHPIDPSAAAVMARLDELGPSRLSTLAGALCLDISTVSRQVPALERHGWVARERDPEDHRAQLLDLTDAGRAVLAGVRHARSEVLRRLLPDWTESELTAFAGQLSRFNADITTHRNAATLAPAGAAAGQENNA
ncbi:MAG: MarR family transcriptional regulator [Frankiales bacterium]|nr:MarR family transcriptional regulator [Frankiales bacterium]